MASLIDKSGDKKQPLIEDNDQLPLAIEFRQMATTAVQLSSTRIVRILLTTIDTAFLGHLGKRLDADRLPVDLG